MCTVSMVSDHYIEKWPYQHPSVFPKDRAAAWPVLTGVSREEFDALKREVADLTDLVKRAVKYDEDNNEPHCEIEEKMDTLRRVAEAFGIDLDAVIGRKEDAAKA